MKKFILLVMLFVALGVTKAATAGQDADWYFNSYQAVDPWGDTGNGQFKTTEDDNIFLLKGLYITESGVKFCVRNGDWSSRYGWSEGVGGGTVNETGKAFKLASVDETNGWMTLPEGVYDVTWNTENSTIQFDASNITITIDAYGWATFSSDYALDFSKATTGLEAYMITGHDGTVVTKSQVTGTVPAGTGLLLKGAEGDYNIPVVANSETNVSENKMKAGTGASVSYEASKTKYVLGVSGSGEAEFQKIVDGGSAATVAKGKAYLQFNEEILARSMRFSGDITGVENVEAAAEAKAKEGKFIENGKLVIVKNGVKYNAAGAKLY